MNAGAVEDFRGVEVADAGHGLLVQQGHLDRPAAALQALCATAGGNLQGIGAKPVGAIDAG